MNLKRIFGAILTVLGIIALIYVAVFVSNNADTQTNIKSSIIFGVIGLLFFIAGIGLIRTTKDEA